MPLSLGQILNNRYRIVKLLGQGGMGAVYRAWDINLNMAIAIKENLDVSSEAQRQFQREAQILAHLSHPNLPRVGDHFLIPGQGQYLVMDFVEGEDLASMLIRTSGPLPEAQVLPWITQVCQALTYLHSQNPPIIHRDIKPANIKVTPQGKAMLVDFGIAKVFNSSMKTTMGARAVTRGYSPPEQYGQGSTDPLTDVYALGATSYALLTGHQPIESIQRSTGTMLLPPRQLNPLVSPSTENAILKAMEIVPAKRWQSMEEFEKALVSSSSPPSPILPEKDRSGKEKVNQTVVAPYTPENQPWQHSAPVPQAWQSPAPVDQPWQSSSPEPQPWEIPAPVPSSRLSSVLSYLRSLPKSWLLGAAGLVALVLLAILIVSAVLGKSQITDKQGVKMRLIPEGAFTMGGHVDESVEECKKVDGILCGRIWFDDQEPSHSIFLDDFYMDLTEVTNVMYQRCVGAGNCTEPIDKSSSSRRNYYGNPDYKEYPVIHVNWEQARDYCEWRGARLPTEAEWEKAAQGGLKGKLYPWGDQEPDCERANYNNCVGDTSKVGSYPTNDYGLFDMAGNVEEWIWDWYSSDYYASSPSDNPSGPASGESRGYRGSNYLYTGENLIVYTRWGQEPSKSNEYLGFRCAR